ncbi:hypothetical protein Mgra_00004016 [Meloidogyne graminicola]|uniref:C2 domain-containing protein n=1 Tax=Meloidogyne graminicola TaxID=189291 RepID=A0A8S9ZTN6_9BILA|nr:hypothetical protein Mgra_00004016 [Meloidogyne graminicola]
MSEWKRKTSNGSNSASSVGKIQSWAKGQINRAAGYIRQVSRDFAASFDEEEENAGRVRERREIVKSSDGHFFERLTIGDDIDLTTIMPNKYIETNNAQLLLDNKKPVKNCISSSKQLAEHLEQQKKHINIKFIQKSQILLDGIRKDLYLETVYTILHRIGKKSSSASIGGVACAFGDEQLLQYAKSAFQIDEKTHKTLVEKALSEKPPILLLNVLLLEARDLIAKDIDGFSDPFVMLGVIPSSSSAKGTEEQQEQTEATNATNFLRSETKFTLKDSPEEEQNNSGKPPQHRRVLQRLSGSFRRKAFPVGASRREKLEAAFEQTGDGIPARIIKASSVQRKTLNPKWNEKFQFVVGDCTDRFHLDIWYIYMKYILNLRDHDDENRSVLDVVSSLNQVQGLKGLGRYFKEVTQSARASSGGSCGGGGDGLVDDFLGSVTFSLGEIPSTGVEQWFNLEKRSEKSEVSGQIKLKMWLSSNTREEHRLSSTEEQRNDDFIFLDDDADGLVDVQQHKDLLRQFSLFEIGKKGEPVCAFRGQLPDLALLILHQHAIQSDLTELHQLIQWLAYIQMIGMGISFELIYETFSKLISKWKPMELDKKLFRKDEEYVLADSLLQFSEFCRSAILRHRLRIKVRSGSRRRSPSPKRSELESFGEMLKCYRLVRESSVFAHLVSYQTHFRTEVRELLEKSAHLHFDAILLNIEENIKNNKNNNNSSAINCLYLLIHSINTTLERSSKFEELFKQEMLEIVNYADISYCTFDLLLHEHIISELTSEDCSDLRAITQLCHHEENQHNNTNNITDEEQILLPILQVHLALNEFAGYRHILMTGTTGHFQYRMEQLDWSTHFDKAIQRWLEFAQVHAFSRLDLSLNLDCQSPIILLNNDIRQTVSAMDACHILEQLLFIWERLRHKILLKNLFSGSIENMQLRASLTIRLTRLLCKISKHFTDQIIMRLNSCEQVRRCLACSDRLKLDEINEDGCYYDNENSTLRNQIEQQLDNCSQNIVEQIESPICLSSNNKIQKSNFSFGLESISMSNR